MPDNPIERAIRRQLADKAIETLTASEDIDASRREIERVVWQAISDGVQVDAPDAPVETFHVSGTPIDGQSVKPSNLQLETGELFETLASGALAVGTAASFPILIPAAAIVLYASLKRNFTIDLDTEVVFVYWTIWNAEEDAVTKSQVYRLVNDAKQKSDLQISLSESGIESALDRLVRINAIEVISTEDGEYYRPREKCRVTWGIEVEE